jgi:hypothetical protein
VAISRHHGTTAQINHYQTCPQALARKPQADKPQPPSATPGLQLPPDPNQRSAAAVAVSGANRVAIAVASAFFALSLPVIDDTRNQATSPTTTTSSTQYTIVSKRLRKPDMPTEATFGLGRTFVGLSVASGSRSGFVSDPDLGPGMSVPGPRTGLYGTPRDIQRQCHLPWPFRAGADPPPTPLAASRRRTVPTAVAPSGVASTAAGSGSSTRFGL